MHFLSFSNLLIQFWSFFEVILSYCQEEVSTLAEKLNLYAWLIYHDNFCREFNLLSSLASFSGTKHLYSDMAVQLG